MDQLPHAAVCEPKFRGDLVLREALDEDGSQRLVLTVIGRGIGVQEEMSVTRVIHGRPPRVLVDFRWLAPRDSLIRTRVTSQDRRSPSSSNSGRIPENWLPYTWAGQQKHSVLAGRTVSQFPPAKIGDKVPIDLIYTLRAAFDNEPGPSDRFRIMLELNPGLARGSGSKNPSGPGRIFRWSSLLDHQAVRPESRLATAERVGTKQDPRLGLQRGGNRASGRSRTVLGHLQFLAAKSNRRVAGYLRKGRVAACGAPG
jgi:hypothetical protein